MTRMTFVFYVIIRFIHPSRLILMTSKVWLYVIGRGIYKVERFSYVIGCGVNVIKRPGCTFPHWPTKASDRLV